MIGSRLGPWIIDEEIGRGGMGCVYKAHADPAPPQGPRVAALKVLAAELATDPGLRQRFQREIDALRKLDHPGIVRFLSSDVQDGRYYFAMEYVDGPSYQELLERQGKLPWTEVLELALQLAPALEHAHDRGVIHRDLKPSNLLRSTPATPDQPAQVKLTDFGIASLFASTHLTAPGGVVGTAEYLSPEQASGKPVTRRSDLYSLGVVLYTLLTGRTPFEGEIVDLLHKHLYGRFERPIRLVPEIPAEFDEIICQLLEKEPAKRPADGGLLYRRLDSFKRKLERRATPPGAVQGDAASLLRPGEGPATLASRLVREELERQNRGGPARRLFNRPWVLVPLFLLTLGLILWSLWPLDAEGLYQRGAALMNSSNPDDWYRAWDDYLGRLERDHPTHRVDEVKAFKEKLEAHRAEREAERAAQRAGPMTEAQWFYQLGLRRRLQGDEEGAKRAWEALRDAFQEVPSAQPWVRKATEQLAAPPVNPEDRERQSAPLREAQRRVRQLREQGRVEEAKVIQRGLDGLEALDPAVGKLLR